MIEHRLIERMLALMKARIPEIVKNGKVDLVFIDTAGDFIRFYADRTHHGKEEDILFRDMAKKQMAPEHASMMNDLIKEHAYAREQVAALWAARNKCMEGDSEAPRTIAKYMQTLIDFYPGHIEKEDRVFFPAAMHCLTTDEQNAMLAEFWEFDRKLIHEKYRSLVERWESSPS